MASITAYISGLDFHFSSFKRIVGIKLEDFVDIIRLILDNTQESTMHWEGYDLKNDGTRGLDIEKETTGLSMNSPGENHPQSGSDDNSGGKKAFVDIDNPAEQKRSADTETLPADFKKAIKELNHACNKFNSIDKKNYNNMVPRFVDLHRDYSAYLDEEEKKELLDTLNSKIDTSGELIDVHEFWKTKRRVNDAYWNKNNKMFQNFERNSKSIQQKLGGKKDLKSVYFRKALNNIKTAYSENYKEKEAIIKKQLAKSRNVDKLLKENNMTVHDLWDKIIK